VAKPAKTKTIDAMSLLPEESGSASSPDVSSPDVVAMRPLAERMRPRSLDDMVGQRRLLAPASALRRAVEAGRVHSMILWGPPGCGKTTLALLLARYAEAEFVAISAVLSGLPQVRERAGGGPQARAKAAAARCCSSTRCTASTRRSRMRSCRTSSDGTILFVGATTENPSFELNSALLSRCRVHVLEAVSPMTSSRRCGMRWTTASAGWASAASRRGAVTRCEIAPGGRWRCAPRADPARDRRGPGRGEGADHAGATLHQVLADRTRRFDKGGEQFYDQISALHKTVRSSNPDAALYWLARMLDGGCDPAYLARRLTRMASEDIGLADPRALQRWRWTPGRPTTAWVRRRANWRWRSSRSTWPAAKSNAAYSAYGTPRAPLVEEGRHAGRCRCTAQCARRADEGPGLRQGYQYDHDAEGGVAHWSSDRLPRRRWASVLVMWAARYYGIPWGTQPDRLVRGYMEGRGPAAVLACVPERVDHGSR
jgi:putative ATPase